jgi:hypothetical protein
MRETALEKVSLSSETLSVSSQPDFLFQIEKHFAREVRGDEFPFLGSGDARGPGLGAVIGFDGERAASLGEGIADDHELRASTWDGCH